MNTALKKEQTIVDESLTSLGQLQLDIAKSFSEFKRMSDDILASLGKSNLENNLAINLPQHKLDQIKKVEISATSFLASMAGGAATGGVTSFAVYSGVMAFAAASTGTPIAALSGAAAYNATMAAIGGGSLAAGGFGMAGGAAILGSVAAAPVLAIIGTFLCS